MLFLLFLLFLVRVCYFFISDGKDMGYNVEQSRDEEEGKRKEEQRDVKPNRKASRNQAIYALNDNDEEDIFENSNGSCQLQPIERADTLKIYNQVIQDIRLQVHDRGAVTSAKRDHSCGH